MKITKSRLMQIIQEEIAHINEVEIQRRGRKDRELELYDRWRGGDEEAFRKLYDSIKPKIMNFLRKKNIKTTDDASIEDTAQGVFLKILEDPNIFKGGSTLSTFLTRNALNAALDKFRRVSKFGGTPTKTGETTAQSDIAQQAGETLPTDIMGGSRFPSPEKSLIAKDAYAKLKQEDPAAAEAFMLSYIGYTGEEIANMTGSSQPAVSRGVNRAKEILRSLEEAALPANEIQEEELSLEKMISEVLSELV